jgi:hypothetical protein
MTIGDKKDHILPCPLCGNLAFLQKRNSYFIRIITCYECKITTVLPKKINEKMLIENYSMRVY